MSLKASVIIPTHNRSGLLLRILLRLSEQTVSHEDFEVIVIMDGTTDDTEKILREFQASTPLIHLSWHRQSGKGPAAARNLGASHSSAEILLFLDDDVIPEADWIETHLSRHKASEPVVVLGDYLVEHPSVFDYAALEFWRWWKHAFWLRTIPDRTPQYRDFLSGNVSVRRIDFENAGGFDEAFRYPGREDYDLGYRLLQGGVRFVVERHAAALHDRNRPFSIRTVKRGSEIEAEGDLQLARKFPQLRRSLRCCKSSTGRDAFIARLAFHVPLIGSSLSFLFTVLAFFQQKLHMRRAWYRSYKYIQHYTYWREIRKAAGSADAVLKLQESRIEAEAVHLDLSEGLPEMLPDFCAGETEILISFDKALIGSIKFHEPRERTIHQNLAEQIATQFAEKNWD